MLGGPGSSGDTHRGAATVSAGSFATTNQPRLCFVSCKRCCCSSRGAQLCSFFKKKVFIVTSDNNGVMLTLLSPSFSSVGLKSQLQSPVGGGGGGWFLLPCREQMFSR